ncbi:MAG: 6-phospho-beta-glucosidase [Firmicutes bacterium]|nr:6-phospho-beta-glucosidase [Bacillota bacterium]
MKIAVIGSGSTYTPELVEGLIAHGSELGLKSLYLMDINSERLRVVGGLVGRMVAKAGNSFRVELTESRREAVAGADFVLTQLRVGGQQARHTDTILCLEENLIGQETTGPAGFAKALRTIPVMLDICKDMRELAPNAWLINFTNPSGIITEAILKYGGVRGIGLCNIPIGIQTRIAQQFQVDHEAVDLEYVGLNHLAWVRKIWVNGQDVSAQVLSSEQYQAANIPELSLPKEFLGALGMVPNSYLRYFYLTDEMLRDLKAREKTRAQQVMEIEAALLEKYEDSHLADKPEELSKRGGAHYSTAAVSLIRSIVGNAEKHHIVNVQNNGAIVDLPPEAVIEVNASVDSRGAHPLAVGRLEPEIRGLIQHVKAYEELTVEAAVHSDYSKALLALANNPLVDSVNKAKRLLDRFIEVHKLPLE